MSQPPNGPQGWGPQNPGGQPNPGQPQQWGQQPPQQWGQQQYPQQGQQYSPQGQQYSPQQYGQGYQQSPAGAQQVPPPKKSHTGIIIAAIAAAVVFVVIVGSCTAMSLVGKKKSDDGGPVVVASSTGLPGAGKSHKVTYKVTTNGPVTFNYGGASDSMQGSASSNWEKTTDVTAKTGFDVLSMIVTSSDYRRSDYAVGCEILVDGVSQSKDGGKPGDTVATCTATLS